MRGANSATGTFLARSQVEHFALAMKPFGTEPKWGSDRSQRHPSNVQVALRTFPVEDRVRFAASCALVRQPALKPLLASEGVR